MSTKVELEAITGGMPVVNQAEALMEALNEAAKPHFDKIPLAAAIGVLELLKQAWIDAANGD